MSTEELIRSPRQPKSFQRTENIVKLVPWGKVLKLLGCIFIVISGVVSIYGLFWLALQSDESTEKILNSVPICPCNVSTTWEERQFGFATDSACDARKSSYWNCRLHQGAKGCYRQKSATSVAGAQCCYDQNGRWIGNWRKGAGTLDFTAQEQEDISPSISIFSLMFSRIFPLVIV